MYKNLSDAAIEDAITMRQLQIDHHKVCLKSEESMLAHLLAEKNQRAWDRAARVTAQHDKFLTVANAPVVSDLENATPQQIDFRIARVDGEISRAKNQERKAADDLQGALDQVPIKTTKSGVNIWRLTTEQVKAEATRVISYLIGKGVFRDHLVRQLRTLNMSQLNLSILETEMSALHSAYLTRGWTRYVGIEGGHVHRGGATRGLALDCDGGTVRPSSRPVWYPHLSGLLEADAIAVCTDQMCTHCYPDAPVRKPKLALGHCPGSGQSPRGTESAYGDFWRCSECDNTSKLTNAGLLRKHKPYSHAKSD